MRPVALCSKPTSALTRVVMSTTMRMPGRASTGMRLTTSMSARLNTDMARVGRWVSGR